MNKIQFTEKQKEDIISLYKEGWSSRKLAKQYKVSKFVILNQIKHLDFRNTQRIYYRDNTRFKYIQTEEDAYFLGLMFADGYNNEKEGRITLSLGDKDIELLEKFKSYFQTNQPILGKVRESDKHQNVALLSINDKEISINLANHGCTQKKTFTLKFPKLKADLINHFIRGYFDGDGSIYNSAVSFVGTESFLLDLNEELYQRTNVNYSTIRNRYPDRENSIRETRYIGKNKVLELYNYLYYNATVFLTRKKLRFEKHLKLSPDL